MCAATAVGVLLIAFASCGGSGTGRITDHLELSKTRVVAGQSLKATLVVNNPGSAINLTRVCRPAFLVDLVGSSARQDFGFTSDCMSGPFMVRRGTSRFSIPMVTTYSGCISPGGQSIIPLPNCSTSGPPSLPPGKYTTQVEWSETVPLPKPRPLTVLITAAQ